MDIIGNLLLVSIRIIMFTLFIRVLIDLIDGLTSVRFNRNNLIITFLRDVTEPFLLPFKRILPQISVGLDTSPLFAFASLDLLYNLLVILFIII